MKNQKLLSVFADDQGEVKAWMPDSDRAVIALSNYIFSQYMQGNHKPFDTLFSVSVQVLARDITGKSLENYAESLKQVTPVYTDALKKAKNQKKS